MAAFTRYTRTGLHLPVQTWTKDGQLVHLIGMIHVADPRFYSDTTTLLEELEQDGATVYMEGVRYADGSVPSKMVLQYLTIHSMFDDLVHQALAMPRRPQWRYVDLTVEQMLEIAPDPDAVRQIIAPALADVDRRSATTIGALFRSALVPVVSASGRFAAAALGSSHGVIVEARNRHVLETVLTHDHDAALPWGAAHLPGMGKILTNHGFELAGAYWRPAITKRKLLGAITASRAASRDHEPWPWEGATLPETMPSRDVPEMLRARGWITDPIPV